MTLPIDPRAVEPADVGEQRVELAMDHESAIERVREICTDAGFGVPVEFSPAELLNEKIDADRDPYYVLGACNPRMADRGLDGSANQLGALFPCNFVIWEQAPGTQVVYHVSIMRIARLVGLAPDTDEWDAIVAETGDLVGAAFDRLRDEPAAVA
jgi:uncharacterized protein (DUF302 family)